MAMIGLKAQTGRKKATLLLWAALLPALLSGRALYAEPGLETGTGRYMVFTAYIPPYVAPGKGGEIIGSLVAPVEAFLNARKVPYKMALLPWSATYRRAVENPHALIFPVDRTAAREDRFHWIKPLVTTHYYIYGLRDKVAPTTTLEDIRTNGDLVSCTKNSIQCELLLKSGIADENILRIEGASITDRFNLMVRNRNFFTVFDPLVFAKLVERDTLDADRLIKLEKVGDMTSYLAANRRMPGKMLAPLLTATE